MDSLVSVPGCVRPHSARWLRKCVVDCQGKIAYILKGQRNQRRDAGFGSQNCKGRRNLAERQKRKPARLDSE